MRKLSFYLLFAGLVFLSSCDKDHIKINQDYELEYGETADFNKGDFTIRFDEVLGDSRCPSCCLCTWAGVVKVKLVIEEDAGSTDIEMIMPGLFFESQNFPTVEYQDYSIELKEVNPYPEDFPSEEADYNIVFSINEL